MHVPLYFLVLAGSCSVMYVPVPFIKNSPKLKSISVYSPEKSAHILVEELFSKTWIICGTVTELSRNNNYYDIIREAPACPFMYS